MTGATRPDPDVPASLAGLSHAQLTERVRGAGDAPYRADQVFQWIHRHGAADYDAMSNVPRRLRDALAERSPVTSSDVRTVHASEDGTTKLLVGLADGATVECVHIPEVTEGKDTACISTQVGCGVGCLFCASGADGVVRNLDASEIVEQFLHLGREAGKRISHLVVMGMGEPLHNVTALAQALRVLQDPRGADLGARRITISTAGPVRGFQELLETDLRVNLALSLHAADEEMRKRLVPRGGTGTVAEIAEMARRWFERTRRDVTFEYVLLAGVNDRDRDVESLARLVGRHRNLNVIPMNPVSHAPDLRAPAPERTRRFVDELRRKGVVVHARTQRGDDVAAACGQLRLAKG